MAIGNYTRIDMHFEVNSLVENNEIGIGYLPFQMPK